MLSSTILTSRFWYCPCTMNISMPSGLLPPVPGGYIMKQEAMESVVTAIHHVLEGKIYLNEMVKEHILSTMSNPQEARKKTPVDRLTDRELQVFKMIGRGFSSREIAERLFLSIKTIGTYREWIKEKLFHKHANELVRCTVHQQNSLLSTVQHHVQLPKHSNEQDDVPGPAPDVNVP